MNRAVQDDFKRTLGRFWVFSPERLWLLSIGLHGRGRWRLAFVVKQLGSLLYHNSLAPGAKVAPDVALGHNGLGIVIHSEVEIGSGVTIWHNATLTAGRPEGRRRGAALANGAAPSQRSRIVVEDHATIGAGAVLIAPRGKTLTIGRGARIGANAVVTEDVPNRCTVVPAPVRVLPRPQHRESTEVDQTDG
ncbi:MAG: serine O-acetyltransferase [Solirubrobacteraceae bacterium]